MKKRLYYHKTDGGAEYLTDTFIAWKHDGKSGREGAINEDTKLCIRIDGDITKDVEVYTDNSLDLLDALKLAQAFILANRHSLTVKPDRVLKTIRDAVKKAESA